MFRRFKKNDPTAPLDRQIDDVLTAMEDGGVVSEKYPELLANLERLNKIKAEQRQNPISRDTIALILGNLAGILLIIAYEQKHVVTSKGFSQLIRPKT